MKNILNLLLAALLLFTACQGEKEEGSSQKADLIIKNGKIATLANHDEIVEALAIKDGKFLAVGSNNEIEKFIGKDTKVIDASKRTVIPGLNDSHSHTIRGGLNYNLELRWDGVKSLKRALEMLKEQADRTPEGQWIKVVGGWSEFQFEERRLPTLEEINAAVPDKPVIVTFLYTYGMLNKKAIEVLGYDKNTTFAGAEVQLDKNQQPTGLLIAKPSAAIIYLTLVKTPKLSPEDQYNSTLQYNRELNRLGLTSVVDAGGGGQFFPDNYQVMRKVADDKKLTLRIGYNIFNANSPGKELQAWKKYLTLVKPGDDYDLFRPNGYMMAGAGENIVWSAGDYENFLQPRPELGHHMEAELEEAVTQFVENKWPFRIHGTYGESIERFLDLFEKINEKTPFNGLRWIIDHGETVSEESLDRIKALGGSIAIQNRMMFQGEYFVDRYGIETAQHAPPIRKILEKGIPLGLGTDGARVSSYNPWLAIYWITTGKTWGGLKHLSQENILNRMDALRLMTYGSAQITGEEALKGTIEKGKFADFVILAKDYFTVDEEDLKNMNAVLTVVNGDIVYGEEEFAHLAPEIPEVSPAWSPVKFYGGYQY
ncbi:amidohydrolase [Xanthovirga aplysinae]|uniref:amidohydrolase n=1 Tax=Xanthovirga aplysinae TaxID=2529853 RepID=UPI0012BB8A38|nr:amidohydrolase [Xanthovirga aplysinae]MTI32186.1 amidohydrolase [Xanthovirga aplysinae]